VNSTPTAPNGFKVAVIGSGPSGLICAHDLARLGYSVTVFECQAVPGGLLVQGIPAFKLERAIVERRIDLLKKIGVQFRVGVRMGQDLGLPALRREFDAIFLGIGARQARLLDLPGAHLDGVVPGVTFLMAWNSGLLLGERAFEVRDRRVVVLGAGDTAMDCLRTALRGGARTATCLYRRDESQMPAMRKHYSSAVEEGSHFVFRTIPVELLPSPEGKVRALRCVPAPIEAAPVGEASTPPTSAAAAFEIEADVVIVAFGFDRVPCPPGCGLDELDANAQGYLATHANGMTSLPGVFAGGDLVHGPGQLVETVREARRAARGIHAWLQPAPGIPHG
jgi:glutamate synthase (NADPH/NADH) small chain